jgi:predicted  nucleic acid-binding Zn-ribbon protein
MPHSAGAKTPALFISWPRSKVCVAAGATSVLNGGMSNFAQMLDSLWVVQDLDQQMLALKERADKAAKEARHANDRHAKAVAASGAALQKLAAAKAKQSEVEAEIKRLEKRVRQLEGDAAASSVDAVTKHRAQIDELETQGLEQIELVQALEVALVQSKQNAETEQQKAAHQAAVAAQEADFVAKAMEPLARTMQEVTAGIAPEVLTTYQSAHARWPGKALCRVVESYCEGCRAEINQQHVVRVKARAEIIRCPHCLRIHDAPVSI